MRRIRFVNFCIAVTVLVARTAQGGAVFDVNLWRLGTGVQGTFPNTASALSAIVMNPFQRTDSARVGSSMATTTYSFTWNDTFGDFLIQASHRAADVDPSFLRSISSGYMHVRANSDLLITIDGSYSYALPVDPMLAEFGLTVTDVLPPYDTPIALGDTYDTEFGAPASGSFFISGQAILPAGRTWRIGHGMDVDALGGLSGQMAQGDGYVHFTLQAMPEPATLGLLILGSILIHRAIRKPRR